MRNPENVNPLNDLVMVVRDEYPTQVKGIILTEQLPTAANVAYFSGRVIKLGDKALKTLGVSGEDILNKKIAYRRYLSECITLREKLDGKEVFLIKAKDIELIIDDDVTVNLL